MSLSSSENVLGWAETLTEAYFLQQTLFACEDEDQAYMVSLLDKVGQLVEKETQSGFMMAEVAGELD